ncbi:hypothetical protein EIP91_005300 [Steccherinum ochraceum]|uniref:Uncharacterized protein n=1 Tax=Steccherinum ochraceum TaxID=92696 RepID=A0A4R0R7D1_9APHY|nr:hypothetical protein EIP91_005300 [Steccherinum ochraceum]
MLLRVLEVSYINKTLLILSDIYVIATTCALTYPMLKSGRMTRIPEFLFRDGLTDFALLLILTSLDLAYLRAFKLYNPLPTILDVLTYVLVCNFMFEIRNIASSRTHGAVTADSLELSIDTHRSDHDVDLREDGSSKLSDDVEDSSDASSVAWTDDETVYIDELA